MNTIQVLEFSNPRVENGVIFGVKIIGTDSRNGYTYPIEVLQKAKSKYESSPVFISHGGARDRIQGSRHLSDHFGNLQNIHERGAAGSFGIFGDLHTKPSHPLVKEVLERIEMGPEGRRFGLSHNAVIDMSDDGKQVTEIVSVNSVDLVDKPATTINLFEEDETMDKKQLEEIADSNSKLEERISKLEQVDDAGNGGGDAGDGEKLNSLVSEVITLIEEVIMAKLKGPEEGTAGPEGTESVHSTSKKKTRLTALEKIQSPKNSEGEGEGEGEKIGDSHDDLKSVIQGFKS